MFGFLYFEQGIKLLYAISAVVALKWFGTSFLLFVTAFYVSMIYDILNE